MSEVIGRRARDLPPDPPDPRHGQRTNLGVPFVLTAARATIDPQATGLEFEGLASVFGVLIDTWVPTRIFPGAFTKTLQEQAGRVKILWQHNDSEPIGKPKELRETPDGLFIRGLLANTQRGREAAELLKAGVVDQLSIGFDPVTWTMVDVGNGVVERHITELRLWEVSLVSFGANPEAKVTAVHRAPRTAAELDALLEQVDRILEDARRHARAEREHQLRQVELVLAAPGRLPPGTVRW